MRKVKRKKNGFFENLEAINRNTKEKFEYFDNLIRNNAKELQKKFEYVNKRPVFYNHDSIIFLEYGVVWIYTLPESRGKGNATKLMKEYIVFLNLLKSKRIEVTVKKDNIASIRMFEKVGFKRNMEKTFSSISKGSHSEREIIFELDITRELLDKLYITQEVLDETATMYSEYLEYNVN